MKEHGREIKLKEKEQSLKKVELLMKENGRTMYTMDMVKRNGMIIQSTKDIILMVKNMEKGPIHGPMVQCIKVTGKITKCTVRVNILEKMENAILGNGLKIIWKEQAYILGLMDENMKDSILIILNMEKGFLKRLMGTNTMVIGKMDISMD